jgi:hypothetical protein
MHRPQALCDIDDGYQLALNNILDDPIMDRIANTDRIDPKTCYNKNTLTTRSPTPS